MGGGSRWFLDVHIHGCVIPSIRSILTMVDEFDLGLGLVGDGGGG